MPPAALSCTRTPTLFPQQPNQEPSAPSPNNRPRGRRPLWAQLRKQEPRGPRTEPAPKVTTQVDTLRPPSSRSPQRGRLGSGAQNEPPSDPQEVSPGVWAAPGSHTNWPHLSGSDFTQINSLFKSFSSYSVQNMGPCREHVRAAGPEGVFCSSWSPRPRTPGRGSSLALGCPAREPSSPLGRPGSSPGCARTPGNASTLCVTNTALGSEADACVHGRRSHSHAHTTLHAASRARPPPTLTPADTHTHTHTHSHTHSVTCTHSAGTPPPTGRPGIRAGAGGKGRAVRGVGGPPRESGEPPGRQRRPGSGRRAWVRPGAPAR